MFYNVIILLPLFGKKWNRLMRSPCRLYILRINLWITEPIFMWLCMYIMAPEPFPTAYFMNPSHQSVCVSPASFLGNSSINAFPRQQNIVGCVGSYAVSVVSKEPLVIIMFSLYNFVITCAVSWPYFGAVFNSNSPPTSVLPCPSRELHICSLAQRSVLWHSSDIWEE
jgi:hypothetical protein